MSTPRQSRLKKFLNSRCVQTANHGTERQRLLLRRPPVPARPTLSENVSGTRYSWKVNGMDCAACARKVENAVRQVRA